MMKLFVLLMALISFVVFASVEEQSLRGSNKVASSSTSNNETITTVDDDDDATLEEYENEEDDDEGEENTPSDGSSRRLTKQLSYQVIDGSYNYYEAKAICKTYKGKLAQIKKSSQQYQIQATIPYNTHAWIGGDSLKKKGVWRWNDNTVISTGWASLWNLINVRYTNWLSSDPNYPDYEFCMVLWDNHKWGNYPCGLKLPALCQFTSS